MNDPPVVVIGELKLTFNLELILQAVDRAGACDEVWLAARLSARGKGRESDARYRNLCRRLGFGLKALHLRATGQLAGQNHFERHRPVQTHLARAEHELPDPVRYSLEWLIAVATAHSS